MEQEAGHFTANLNKYEDIHHIPCCLDHRAVLEYLLLHKSISVYIFKAFGKIAKQVQKLREVRLLDNSKQVLILL
jgi:hypothetical protein